MRVKSQLPKPVSQSSSVLGYSQAGSEHLPSLLPPGTLRFAGEVPAGARQCRITYGLVLGSYVLTLVSPAGERSAPIWLPVAIEMNSAWALTVRAAVPLA